jgi:hypothetical protein
MDIRKYEQMINLVINEDHEQASELFHEIVVEKSREIFESIMAEEQDDDMDEGMGGQVGDLLDEINAEESGVMEEDESDIEFDDEAEEDGEDFTHDLEADHDEGDEEAEHEEIEDAVIRIEDKLDQLMAEFEEIMGNDAGGEEDFGDEGDFDDSELGGEEDEMDEDMMMENVNLQQVSVTHGDNGAYTKSPAAFNSGQAGMDSKPVKFADGNEKGRTAPPTKDLKGAGQFKNVPGKKSQDLSAAPKPKHGDDGQNTKSPVAESRKRAPARRPTR